MSDFETYAAYGRSIGYAREAGRQQGKAEYWEEYAHRLEAAINNLRRSEAAQIALKHAALNEIQKLDPKNLMLNQQHRKQIYDVAFNKPLKD